MATRQFYILLFVIVITQVLGFALVLSRMPAAPSHDEDARLRAALDQQNQSLNAGAWSATAQDANNAAISPQNAALTRMVENVLRQALANVLNQPHQAAASQPPEQAPTPDQQDAAGQALSVIDTAISSGVWTMQDNQALLPYAARLTHAQRVELINHFAQAMQNKQLVLQGPPPAL